MWPWMASARFSVRNRPGTAVLVLCGFIVVSHKVVIHLDEKDAHDTNKRVSRTSLSNSIVQQHRTVHRRGWRFVEESNVPGSRTGIQRYEFAQVDSGRRSTTKHNEVITHVPSGFWSFFALSSSSDNGPAMRWLGDNLLPAVVSSVADLYSTMHGMIDSTSATAYAPREKEIQRSMVNAFGWLENDPSRPVPRYTGDVAASEFSPGGNIALFYDSHTRQLHFVSTASGYKAILGRRIRSKGDHISYVSAAVSPENLPSSTMNSSGQTEQDSSALDSHASSTINASGTSFDIQPGDFILLGNKSLWGSLSCSEAIRLIEDCQKRGEATATQTDEAGPNFFAPRRFLKFRNEVLCSENPSVTANTAKNLVQSALHSRDTQSLPENEDIAALVIFFGDDDC